MSSITYRDIPESPEYPHLFVGGERRAPIYTGDFVKIVTTHGDGTLTVRSQSGVVVLVTERDIVRDQWMIARS